MKLIFVSALLFSFIVNAKAKTQNHEAHVHGGATLAVAFDGNAGKIEYKGAADSVLGFEHKPSSDQDKKKITETTTTFETQIAQLIQFDSSLGCKFTNDRIGLFFQEQSKNKGSGEHSDWIANYSVVCAKSPVNTNLLIDFTRFEHIDDMDITLLIGNIQKSAEYKKKVLKIELK